MDEEPKLFRLPLAMNGTIEEIKNVVGGDAIPNLEELCEKQIREQKEGLASGTLFMPLGEIQCTPDLLEACTPVEAMTFLQLHQRKAGLTKEEALLFDEVKESKSGRYLTTWDIKPMVSIDEITGAMVALNHRYLSDKIAIATNAKSKRTVICLESQLPKVGLPGSDDEEVPMLDPDSL